MIPDALITFGSVFLVGLVTHYHRWNESTSFQSQLLFAAQWALLARTVAEQKSTEQRNHQIEYVNFGNQTSFNFLIASDFPIRILHTICTFDSVEHMESKEKNEITHWKLFDSLKISISSLVRFYYFGVWTFSEKIWFVREKKTNHNFLLIHRCLFPNPESVRMVIKWPSCSFFFLQINGFSKMAWNLVFVHSRNHVWHLRSSLNKLPNSCFGICIKNWMHSAW